MSQFSEMFEKNQEIASEKLDVSKENIKQQNEAPDCGQIF